MRNILLSDVTMKQSGKADGFTISFREKIELAKLLDKLCVSVIEAEPIVKCKTDSLLVKSIAFAVKRSVVAVPVSVLDEASVDITWNALKNAARPRMQVPVAVSTVQMEYFYSKKPNAVLEMISDNVSRAKSLCESVEFIALDAGRSEREFLSSAIEAAIRCGADTVTVCDTAGTMLPDEFYQAIKEIRELVPSPVRLGVSCSNAMYMADACAMAAIRAGADEVKTASCGEDTVSIDKLVTMLKLRGETFGVGFDVRATELKRTVEQIRRMCRSKRSSASPFDTGVRDEQEELTLNVHDDIGAVCAAADRMGYDLSEDDAAKVYEAFISIASRKERVSMKELDAIVASAALQVPPAYELESYVINAGNVMTATAHIRLKKDGGTLEGICVGDGPIDAAFLAIEKIAGCHYELDDFQIQAVTEGREAMGETVVRLRSNGKVYSGRGISTDIIGSGILAYINALNKIVYEAEV